LERDITCSGSQRTFQRAKALALGAIKQIAGRGNTLKQQQLAEALLDHYSGGSEEAVEGGSLEYEAHAAVISGLVETVETLKNRNGGRYPTEDRITQEVLLGSVVQNAKGSVLNAVARLLKRRPDSLRKAKNRVEKDRSSDRSFLIYLRNHAMRIRLSSCPSAGTISLGHQSVPKMRPEILWQIPMAVERIALIESIGSIPVLMISVTSCERSVLRSLERSFTSANPRCWT
jgi:hypothetical protein